MTVAGAERVRDGRQTADTGAARAGAESAVAPGESNRLAIDVTRLLDSMRADDRRLAIVSWERGRLVERTRATVVADVMAAIQTLRGWGVTPGMRVGIRAPNCYEWIVYDVALLELRAVSVAFTDDFAGASAEALVEKYALSLLLTRRDGSDHGAVSDAVAYLDEPSAGCSARPPRPHGDARWEHPWLIFSSGSAGGVKGLTLTREGVEESIDTFVRAIGPSPADRLLLFLPMSNFQQRMMYYAALWYGFELILADLPRLFHALKELKPTLLIAPPAFYEMVETQIENVPRLKRLAFRSALAVVRLMPARLRIRVARRVFHQVFDALGGRMRFMVTGMAPIKRSTLDLFRCLQLPLFETYGLIEAGPLTLNVPGANKVGSVGRPLAGVRIDVREDGEIVVSRRRRTAAGYFEAADGEAERTFIGVDTVATGDIGFVDRDGYLHLLGRKKEIIVSRSGEKIHPEAAEAELNACPDVDRAVVLDDDGNGLVAVVRPKGEIDGPVQERIERFAARVSERRPTFSFNAVIVTDVKFSRENGFLRPNLKLDRGRIAAHFRARIDAARSQSR